MLQDLRLSGRELRKRPGLALIAIISLTLGIGATTAVFSVIYSLLARGNVIGGLVCGLLLSVMLSGTLSKWAEGSAHDPLDFAAVTLQQRRQLRATHRFGQTNGTGGLTGGISLARASYSGKDA